jgi:hypothetical protein
MLRRWQAPSAPLGHQLKAGSELHLLAMIVSGYLVNVGYAVQDWIAPTVLIAQKAPSLLRKITRDSWWYCAWTLQEDYRGGIQMELLIRHDPSPALQKRRYRETGELLGEPYIPSIRFFTQKARRCLALRGAVGPLGVQRIDYVLRAAERYTLSAVESRALSQECRCP